MEKASAATVVAGETASTGFSNAKNLRDPTTHVGQAARQACTLIEKRNFLVLARKDERANQKLLHFEQKRKFKSFEINSYSTKLISSTRRS